MLYVIQNKYTKKFVKQGGLNGTSGWWADIDVARVFYTEPSAAEFAMSHITETYNIATGDTLENLSVYDITHLNQTVPHLIGHRRPTHTEVVPANLIVTNDESYLLSINEVAFVLMTHVLQNYEGEDRAIDHLLKEVLSQFIQSSPTPRIGVLEHWKQTHGECWHCDNWFPRNLLTPVQVRHNPRHFCRACLDNPDVKEYLENLPKLALSYTASS